MSTPSIHWFRLDLRLADNPALRAAARRGGAVVPIFVWAPDEEGDWPSGAASKWWLHQSLGRLDAGLREAGSRLVIRRGPTLAALRALTRETGATAVFWNRRYEPAVAARDATIAAALRGHGLEVESFNAGLLHEPWTIRNQSGKPFQVFTPFWRRCLTRPDPAAPLAAPKHLRPPQPWPGVFNPVAQGERFDPQGDYVRRWCPELARLPAAWIHRPHEAPPDVRDDAGVELGRHYPLPIISHAIARESALEAYKRSHLDLVKSL